MKIRKDRHPCSVCGKETCSDLVLSSRSKDPYGVYIPQSRRVVLHTYLCEEHYKEIYEFLLCYLEGGSIE